MELDSLSLNDLRELAKAKGLSNISKLKKNELIEKILEISQEVSEKKLETQENKAEVYDESSDNSYSISTEGDEITEGVLELLPDGYGFLRGDNYLPSQKDVYISPIQIRRFKLDTGDRIKGIKRTPKEGEKFPALIYVGEVNGESPYKAMKRTKFD